MKNDYINSIVYNECEDGAKIYYVVKAFDDQILRIEQLKKQPKENISYAINLNYFRNKKISIIYYGYNQKFSNTDIYNSEELDD